MIDQHKGFPRLIDSGYCEKCDVYYLVMNKLDDDLNTFCMQKNGNSLSLYTAINIAIQLLDRIETLHSLGYVHRDLKPKNVMVEHSNETIVLIDFGLCNRYLTQYSNHIPFRNHTEKLLGTPLFASTNALLGKELSR